MSKVFFDTNILVYSLDGRDKSKRRKARELLSASLAESTGVISTQVLQETWVVSVRKLGLDPLDAKEIIHGFRRFETVMVDPDMIEEAVDIHSVNGVSFWDALILAAAERASCATLLTEDMADGQVVRGVRITNPFRASKPERSR